MKYFNELNREFVTLHKISNISNDINKAKSAKIQTVFLAGTTKDNTWRDDIKKQFKDDFAFVDPYDKNWDPLKSIYKECEALAICDVIVFFNGGKLSKREQQFLNGIGKSYKTFDKIEKLSKYLQSIKE